MGPRQVSQGTSSKLTYLSITESQIQVKLDLITRLKFDFRVLNIRIFAWILDEYKTVLQIVYESGLVYKNQPVAPDFFAS